MAFSKRDKNRVVHSARNIFTTAFFQIILGFVAFAERAVFIRCLSADYLGLNSLFANVLYVLSIAELGIGSAVAYALYKPLADQDERKIYLYMRFFKKAYSLIGLIIIVLGLCLSPFISKLATSNEKIPYIELYFIIYLLSVGISYFFSYKQIIIDADQNKYLSQAIISSGTIVQQLLQMVILLTTHNYALYLIIFFILNIGKYIIISIVAKKKYPVIHKENFKTDKLSANEKHSITINVKAMCYHKFGEVAIGSSDSILIAYLIDIATLGMYANYQLILEALRSSLRIFNSSVQASIGNLCATESSDKIYSSFKTLNFTNYILHSYQPIVAIFFGKRFLLADSTVFLIAISIFLSGTRLMILNYHDAYGLFWADRYKRVLEAIVNLVVSFCLGKKYGINGIFLGTIMSNLVGFGIEGFVVYKHAFKKTVRSYVFTYILQLIVTIMIMLVTYCLANLVESNVFIELLYHLVLCLTVPLLLYYLIYRKNPDFIAMKNNAIDMCKMVLAKRRKNKSDEVNVE